MTAAPANDVQIIHTQSVPFFSTTNGDIFSYTGFALDHSSRIDGRPDSYRKKLFQWVNFSIWCYYCNSWRVVFIYPVIFIYTIMITWEWMFIAKELFAIIASTRSTYYFPATGERAWRIIRNRFFPFFTVMIVRMLMFFTKLFMAIFTRYWIFDFFIAISETTFFDSRDILIIKIFLVDLI